MSLATNGSTIGVLAIQGDFAAHSRALGRVGVRAVEVRRAVDLENIDGLIIPGGESTTMLKLIAEDDLGRSIAAFAREGKPVFGTCAGTILLAREVHNPRQASLGLIDIDVERNAYGRQVDSFIAEAETTIEGGRLEAVFIRAPKIQRVGTSIEVLARIEREPVFVRQGNVLAATFHPELTEDERVHRLFAEMVARSSDKQHNPVYCAASPHSGAPLLCLSAAGAASFCRSPFRETHSSHSEDADEALQLDRR